MPGYHSNLFGYFLDGIGAVYVLGLGLACSLLLGSYLGVAIVHHSLFSLSPIYTLLWFGGVLTGIMQVWGVLSYTLIAFELIALFRASSYRWLILLTILLMQTCETSRMLLHFKDNSAWLQAAALTGIVLLPVLNLVLYRYFESAPQKSEAPYTDCRSCGYNLTGTLAAHGTSCPECGEPVSQYQQARLIAEQRSISTGPR
jgi:predicted RNA-binding Zn-ribbon protein involved in translation (DUF1610 family)